MVNSEYGTLYSCLVDEIQQKGLHVRKSLLFEGKYWTIEISFRSKRNCRINFYRFTYNAPESVLKIDKRKFFRYRQIEKIKVELSNDAKEISRNALEIASSTS